MTTLSKYLNFTLVLICLVIKNNIELHTPIKIFSTIHNAIVIKFTVASNCIRDFDL